MILPRFDYYSPQSLPEAVKWLSQRCSEGVRILAGGTDLLVNLRGKIIPDSHRPRCQEHRAVTRPSDQPQTTPPYWLLALSRLPELKGIALQDNCLTIGAMTTHTELERSSIINRHLPGLSDAASVLGSPLCRNRGTYGGNICNARPASDTTIPTLALKGRLRLISARGERMVEHSDFVTGPGQTILAPDEILVQVLFDLPERMCTSAYVKLANRKALEIAVVGAAAAVWFNPDRTVAEARIALASVAPRPLLIPPAGDILTGKALSEEFIDQAAAIALSEVKPITDHRGGAHYRRKMTQVLVKRALKICRERAEKLLL